MQYEENWSKFEAQLCDFPHHLFMLNKYGQIPLDVAIQESVQAGLDEKIAKDHKSKVDAGAAMQEIKNARQKAQMLILRMQRYGPECSIKFVKKPHRLDLKFEKSFALAVKKNKEDIVELFPINSIKTVYVSLHQLKDYKAYKSDKNRHIEQLTTPLHLACQQSNIEAVRQLVELQNFDVNVLLNEKNFVYELL